jgi:hypothetical protein
MSGVTRVGAEFSVDAAILADALGLDVARVLPAMREKKITSQCERGIVEDEGRTRLTFFYARRMLRLVVDDDGNILDRWVEERT